MVACFFSLWALSTLCLTFLSTAGLFPEITSDNEVFKTLGCALRAVNVVHESFVGSTLALPRHSSIIVNLRIQRKLDLHLTDPQLHDLFDLILICDPRGLSLFSLGLCQDQLLVLFEVVNKILFLDKVIFNGGYGKVQIRDMISRD